jgi:hypothetical protein
MRLKIGEFKSIGGQYGHGPLRARRRGLLTLTKQAIVRPDVVEGRESSPGQNPRALKAEEMP